jgi:hypothetical protein
MKIFKFLIWVLNFLLEKKKVIENKMIIFSKEKKSFEFLSKSQVKLTKYSTNL